MRIGIVATKNGTQLGNSQSSCHAIPTSGRWCIQGTNCSCKTWWQTVLEMVKWCKVEYQVQEEVQRRITSGANIPASSLDTNFVRDTAQLLKLAVCNTNAILAKNSHFRTIRTPYDWLDLGAVISPTTCRDCTSNRIALSSALNNTRLLAPPSSRASTIRYRWLNSFCCFVVSFRCIGYW